MRLTRIVHKGVAYAPLSEGRQMRPYLRKWVNVVTLPDGLQIVPVADIYIATRLEEEALKAAWARASGR